MKRNFLIGSILVAAFTLFGLGQSIATRTAEAQAAGMPHLADPIVEPLRRHGGTHRPELR